MNRISREPSIAGRNIPTGSKQQFFGGRGPTVEKGSEEDENLALFSRIRQNQNTNSPKGSYFHNASVTSERWKMGSPIIGRSKVDDLFSDSGKHDYDWLLTPPGTPLISPSKPSDSVPARVVSRSSSNVTTKASRFSPSQSEKVVSTRPVRSSSTMRPSLSTTNSSTRPIRSSSTMRPSISTTHSSTKPIRSSSTTRPSISTTHSSSSSFHNIRTSALNTSSSSISSRPSTPGSRTSIAAPPSKTTVTASRAPTLRSSTPTRNRQSSAASGDKPRISQNSRPATPTARPRTPSNDLNPRPSAPALRPNSRPSTPTRRTPAVATAPSGSHPSSVSRFPASSNPSTGPASRSNSPAPRAQAPKKPIALPDFSLDAPPNLRTKLPERALSAGRQRPGLPLTVRSNLNSETTVSSSTNIRKSASPIVSRGRLQENPSVTHPNSSGHEGRLNSKKQVATETAARRVIKSISPAERTGLGRTISKYSMDMALKHMDIRKSVGHIRGASLIPQSIRSATQRGQLGLSSDSAVSGLSKASHLYDSGMSDSVASDNESCNSGMFSENFHHILPQETIVSIRTDLKGNGNTFYDEVMLKEDPKNMNWLHSTEDSLI